jgi:hypothetical protein
MKPGDSLYEAIEDPGPLVTRAPQKRSPKYGKTVKCCELDYERRVAVGSLSENDRPKVLTNPSVPDVPLSAGMKLSFEKSEDFGAILLAGAVTLTSPPYRRVPNTWCKPNGSSIIQHPKYGEDVEKMARLLLSRKRISPVMAP